MLSHSIEISL
jgi:hypothetical protein